MNERKAGYTTCECPEPTCECYRDTPDGGVCRHCQEGDHYIFPDPKEST